MAVTEHDDALADALSGEKPLAEQVLTLGKYFLDMLNLINSLSLTVQDLMSKVEELEERDERG